MRTAIVLLVLASGQFSIRGQNLFTAPDVRFMSVDEAQKTMRKAGFAGAFDEEGGTRVCPSVVDDRVVELGQVCDQLPSPGSVAGRKFTVRFLVQRQDPRHGRLGERLEWHLMPKLVGMTEEEALAAMRNAGFAVTERIRVRHTAATPDCVPKRVCRTNPPGNARAGQNDDKDITIAQ